MAQTPIVLTNCSILAGGYDLSASTNKVKLTTQYDALDVTNFASGGAKAYVGGLSNTMLSGEGWTTADSDALYGTNLGVADTVFTVSPDGGDGSVVYGFRSLQTTYETNGGDVGQVYGYTVEAAARSAEGLLRGTVMHPVSTARTSTGTGTIRQLGAVGSTQSVYAWLHVVSATGTTPSVTVKVQSAATVGFGLPADRITFTAANAIGAQYGSTAGAITDQYWRVSYTISGTTPSFLFAVGIAIQ